MEIISKSEAQTRAKALQEIPAAVIREVNAKIAEGYANGDRSVIYYKPDGMERPAWRALSVAINDKGYNVKMGDKGQRDGEWFNIEL